MWKSLLFSALFALVVLSLCVSATAAADALWDIQISESYNIREDYLQRDNLELIGDLHFTRDRSYNLVYLRPSLAVTAAKGVHGYLAADFFWQTPVEEDEGEAIEADASTAYLSLNGRNVSADLGLQPVAFGNGLIMADDALAAAIDVRVGNIYADVKAARVMDHSPMVGLSLGYRPDHYERMEMFGIWYRDRDDTFAYSTPFVYQLFSDLSSEGDLYYLGAAADLFVGNTLFSLVGAYQTGRYAIAYQTAGGQSGRGRADVHAYFADMGLQRNLADWCTAELFCFVASGDAEPTGGELEAFVSITPYNPRAAIFFDPDFLDLADDRRLTFSGGFFNGVIAPGVALTLSPDNGFSAEAALIYMYAHKALNDGSRWYGWEVDVAVRYTVAEKFELFVEAARFEHGDYFESLLDESVSPAMRLSVGLRTLF